MIQVASGDETPNTQRRRIVRGQIANDLKYKRSFFVRMVSDPKIYNPKIVAKSMTMGDSIEESKEIFDPNQSDGTYKDVIFKWRS